MRREKGVAGAVSLRGRVSRRSKREREREKKKRFLGGISYRRRSGDGVERRSCIKDNPFSVEEIENETAPCGLISKNVFISGRLVL